MSTPPTTRTARLAALCALALVGFAANSILTRMALRPRLVDAATFTAIRLVSGAAVLLLLTRVRAPAAAPSAGSWPSALLLVGYAVPFTWAYLRLEAGVGALVVFGSVQATMIGAGLVGGERPRPLEWLGVAMAIGGLAVLTLPGASRPDLLGVLLMVVAGAAWGLYSLRGRGVSDPLGATAGNFLRATPMLLPVLAVAAWMGGRATFHAEPRGVALALASGGLASGVGYAIWYAAVPHLTALRAALLQLIVPILAAGAAVALLDEHLTPRLVVAAACVLGGVVVALRGRAVAR